MKSKQRQAKAQAHAHLPVRWPLCYVGGGNQNPQVSLNFCFHDQISNAIFCTVYVCAMCVHVCIHVQMCVGTQVQVHVNMCRCIWRLFIEARFLNELEA